MSEPSGEKTFAPSAKRRRDAAQRGDVVRSRELATAVAMLAGVAWLTLAGPWMIDELRGALRAGLAFDRLAVEQFAPAEALGKLLFALLPPVVLLGLAVLAVSTVSQLGFGEGRFVPANIAPKASRISPFAGLKRMFGAQGWIELGKSIAKLVLLGGIAWFWGREHLAGIVRGGAGPLEPQLAQAWDSILSLLLVLSLGLLVIAVIDVPIQLVRRFMRLRMTLQETRDEHKEAEGAPEKKAAIRQRQRALAAGGVQRAVREAQFVITNPHRFAVALAYDPARAGAPIVLAKGRGEKALAMRELAAEFAVPMLEYPALARSVYFTTRENQVIREELYVAVASVLAFVLSLKRDTPLPRPVVEVPKALRYGADGEPEA